MAETKKVVESTESAGRGASGPVTVVAPAGRGAEGLGFTEKVLITVGVVLAAGVLAGLVWVARDLLLLAFAGVLLAVIVSWPADLLSRATGVKRGWCLLAVAVGLLTVVGTAGYLMGSRVAEEVQQLQSTLPAAFVSFSKDMQRYRLGAWLFDQMPKIREYLMSSDVLNQLQGLLSTTFGVAGNLAVVVVIALFVALAPGLYRDGLVRLVPPRYRPRARDVLGQVGGTLQWWFFGQLMSMTVIAVLTLIGLEILGVRLAITLAVLAGLLNFIPNFGPILAAVPAVLIAFSPHGEQTTVQPYSALYVIILYVIVQMLEGSLITPMIQHHAVSLPPALIVLFQVLLGLLGGALGLVLATPVLAAVMVLVRTLYVEDTLGDRGEESEARRKTGNKG